MERQTSETDLAQEKEKVKQPINTSSTGNFRDARFMCGSKMDQDNLRKGGGSTNVVHEAGQVLVFKFVADVI